MRWLWFAIPAALLQIWLGLGYYAFTVFCRRKPKDEPGTGEQIAKGPHGQYAEPILAGQAWIEAQRPERVQTRSFDGLRLVGFYIPNPRQRGVAILFHGWHGAWNFDFSCSIPYYHSLGFSVLSVCQRAHGESEGRYLTYGVRERHDVVTWINYVNQRFGAGTPILLGGLSMGSATVQMACGLELPENVRAAVSDCGFTSPYEIGVHVLRRNRQPVWLLLPQMATFCRLLAGFGLRETSTIDAQRKNRVPTFFAHGEDDDFVPCEMSRRNYAACTAPKRLFTVPGARHGVSYLIDRAGYERELREFLEPYFPAEN